MPTMVMMLERASLRLLTASMTTATEFATMPTAALNAASKTLAAMPMRLVRMICFERSMLLPDFCFRVQRYKEIKN